MTMRYLVIFRKDTFFTNWYSYGLHYIDGMWIVDLSEKLVTYDGVNWEQIDWKLL